MVDHKFSADVSYLGHSFSITMVLIDSIKESHPSKTFTWMGWSVSTKRNKEMSASMILMVRSTLSRQTSYNIVDGSNMSNMIDGYNNVDDNWLNVEKKRDITPTGQGVHSC